MLKYANIALLSVFIIFGFKFGITYFIIFYLIAGLLFNISNIFFNSNYNLKIFFITIFLWPFVKDKNNRTLVIDLQNQSIYFED